MIVPTPKPEPKGGAFVRFPLGIYKRLVLACVSRDAMRLFLLIVQDAVSFKRKGRTLSRPLSFWTRGMGWPPNRSRHIPRLLRTLEQAGLIQWIRGQRNELGTGYESGIFVLCLNESTPNAGSTPTPNVGQTTPNRGQNPPTGGSVIDSEPKKLLRETELRITAVAPAVVSLTKDANARQHGKGRGTAGILISRNGTANGTNHDASKTPTPDDAEWTQRLIDLELCLNELGRVKPEEKQWVKGAVRAFAKDTPRDTILDFLGLVNEGRERKINPGKHTRVEYPLRWAIDLYKARKPEAVRESARNEAKRQLARIETQDQPAEFSACIQPAPQFKEARR